MKIARLVTTRDCGRSCSYCCNNQPTAIKLLEKARTVNLQDLAKFDVVCITGGDPLLYPAHTLFLARDLRNANPKQTIYLYTAWWKGMWRDNDVGDKIVKAVDGVQFTLHAGASNEDIACLCIFQDVAKANPGKSYRLFISPEVSRTVPIIPSIWSRVESKPFLEDCPLPENEELCLWESPFGGR